MLPLSGVHVLMPASPGDMLGGARGQTVIPNIQAHTAGCPLQVSSRNPGEDPAGAEAPHISSSAGAEGLCKRSPTLRTGGYLLGFCQSCVTAWALSTVPAPLPCHSSVWLMLVCAWPAENAAPLHREGGERAPAAAGIQAP